MRVAQTRGSSQAQVAAEFGVGLSSLGKWLAKYGGQTGLSQSDFDQSKEVARLRKELRIALEERDVLKKAAIFFAAQKR